jgi:hypothetical protein
MPVTVWTIYREPDDYPGKWVLRGHEVFPGRSITAHTFCYVARTLDEARAKVPAGTRRFRRARGDHPVIHECWVKGAIEVMAG